MKLVLLELYSCNVFVCQTASYRGRYMKLHAEECKDKIFPYKLRTQRRDAINIKQETRKK